MSARVARATSVRAMTVDDLDACARITADELGGAWDRAALAGELARDVSRCRVACEEGEVVALAIFLVVADEAELLVIATHRAHRPRGLARALLEDDEARARTTHLEVRADNDAAIALYEALGFVATHRRAAYYRDGVDAIVMARRPAPATRTPPPPAR